MTEPRGVWVLTFTVDDDDGDEGYSRVFLGESRGAATRAAVSWVRDTYSDNEIEDVIMGDEVQARLERDYPDYAGSWTERPDDEFLDIWCLARNQGFALGRHEVWAATNLEVMEDAVDDED